MEELRAAVEDYRKRERDCPANKTFLGDKPCPKCGANSREPCRETVRAAYAVVDAAKALVTNPMTPAKETPRD